MKGKRVCFDNARDYRIGPLPVVLSIVSPVAGGEFDTDHFPGGVCGGEGDFVAADGVEMTVSSRVDKRSFIHRRLCISVNRWDCTSVSCAQMSLIVDS
ncbi:MAG: hypothetical protein EBU46_07200 [Nitrosomonadaceae bacterium]|nr:hypothetical protein [Nitrosomonadaceae bacterium]